MTNATQEGFLGKIERGIRSRRRKRGQRERARAVELPTELKVANGDDGLGFEFHCSGPNWA